MNRFSIKDIENLTGIKAHTIRIWEQRYGILHPKRTDTNIRYYDAADLKSALRIALLNTYGYKISRIQRMSAEDIDMLIQRIHDKAFHLQALVNQMLELTLAMETERLENLINAYLKEHGAEDTVEQLIFGFLNKLGAMWLGNRLFPAQEHLVSNIIYRKLAVIIEQQQPERQSVASVLLFLPEGEIHEISLMYVQYLLRKQGLQPIYLGANTPLSEVQIVYKAKRPEYLYLHITSVSGEFDGNRYIQKMAATFPDSTIFISGPMLHGRKYQAPANVRLLHDLEAARVALSELT